MSEIAELQVRLSRLESRYRRVQLLSVVSSTLLAGACLTAAFAPVSDELRAHRFVLVDESGKECGALHTSDGASVLRLNRRDEEAGLVLTAGDVECESEVFKGFQIRDGKAEEFTETQVTSGPWAGVIAWTGKDETNAHLTILSAAESLSGVSVAHAQRRARIGLRGDENVPELSLDNGDVSSALLTAADHAAVMSLEGGEETFGVLNVFAEEDGVWLGGDWNDEHDFNLAATSEHVGFTMTTLTDLDPSDGDSDSHSPEIELTTVEGSGAVHVRSQGRDVFKAP